MKLKNHGKSTLNAEVTQISQRGIWLLVNGTEYFLPYADFPWFEKAAVAQIHRVQLIQGFHLRWPDLDVDLDVDSLNHLESYPLVYLHDLPQISGRLIKMEKSVFRNRKG